MIIGLHGRARSGKDTVCQIMREEHRGKVVRKAFADPLKLSACRVFHPHATLDQALAWADIIKDKAFLTLEEGGSRTGLTGRKLLQNYGTEAHRDVFGDGFWVDVSLPSYTGDRWTAQLEHFGINPDVDFVVFTDVRFENEARRIKEWGGEVWEIRRAEVENGDTHASEQRLPLELIDSTFYNNGTLDELRENVIQAITERTFGREQLTFEDTMEQAKDRAFRRLLGQDD
jgi:hypothetical protein